jgi:hypothetical protein
MKKTKKKTKARRKKTAAHALPPRRKMEFPEVKGKTIESFKLYLENDDISIGITFSDKTHLYLDMEPRLTVRADLSDWKTENWRPIKSWPPQHSRSAWTEDSIPDC